MNHEGYSDTTAERAIAKVMRQQREEIPDDISFMVRTFKNMASLLGYDISERIVFKDRKTGKEWR